MMRMILRKKIQWLFQTVLLLGLSISSNPSFSKTNELNILAIEYPPFTTLTEPNAGIAFTLLKEKLREHKVKIKPLFVPPARAAQMLQTDAWCGSFYPPHKEAGVTAIELSQTPVKIGLVRLVEDSPFRWDSLAQLRGKSVAILRTRENSEFSQQFIEAGMDLAYVETIQASVQLVLLERVDMGLADNISFQLMEKTNKDKLQISETALIETPITLFINSTCAFATDVL